MKLRIYLSDKKEEKDLAKMQIKSSILTTKTTIIILVLTVIVFVISVYVSWLSYGSLDHQMQSSTIGNARARKLARLDYLKDSLGFIELPFKANFDSMISPTYRMLPFNEDTVFRKDFNRLGDVYLVGFLPDTTNFYGIVFIGVGAMHNPGLVTFDKDGEKICSSFLTEENCVIYSGEILLCQEFTTINRNLTLDYYFKSVIAGDGMSTDTVCSQSVRKGEISSGGKIELGQITTVDCKN